MVSASETIAQQTQTTHEQYEKIKRLVDFGYFLENYIAIGGVVTKDVTQNNYINVTEIVVSLDNDVTRREAASFKTTVASTTYYLDYMSSGDFNWDTAHYSGSYLPIAEVTTDANKNVLVITDMRGEIGGLRIKDDIYKDGVSLGTAMLKSSYDYNIPKTLKRLYLNQDTVIVIAGDSIGEGAGAQSDSTMWVEILKSNLVEQYPGVNFNFINSSVGSTGTNYLRTNWDQMVGQFNPHLLIISHGTNDTSTLPADIEANYAIFKQRCDAMGTEVLVVTTSTNSFGPASYGNEVNQSVVNILDVMAELVRTISKRYRWGLIDPNLTRFRYLSRQGADISDSTLTHFDHIHPNDIGHRLIAYEVLLPFLAGESTRILDERYGGKNFGLFGRNKTLRDLQNLYGLTNEWERIDLYHPLVTWGGMWMENTGEFKSADLWCTLSVTGTEPYQFRNPLWHIIPRDFDFIEFEVTNAKRVWTQLTSGSADPTTFAIKVNGVVTHAIFSTSADIYPIEIKFDEDGAFQFPKGTHKIRIERWGAIPGPHKVFWGGFIVRYHKPDNKPVSDPNRLRYPKMINTKNVSTTTREIAIDNGVIAPFGFTEFDDGFVQLPLGCNVMAWKFYGTDCKITLKTRVADNTFLVYLDGVLQFTINVKNATTIDQEYLVGNGLDPNVEHELSIIGLNSELNLVKVYAKGTGTGYGVCGTSITLELNPTVQPHAQITPFYPETGQIGFRTDGTRDYMMSITANWGQEFNGGLGVTYVQTLNAGAQIICAFHGTTLLLRYVAWGLGGQVSVTIDGVDKGTLDTYAAVTSIDTQTYGSLAAGLHEIIITMLSTKNAAVTGAAIVQVIDIEQTGITVPTFQYRSKLTPTELIVTGAGEFEYLIY